MEISKNKIALELSNLSKYWKVITFIICGLLMVLPMSSSFQTTNSGTDGVWVDQHVYDTFLYTIVIVPMICLWIFIPSIKNITIRKVAIVLFVSIYIAAFLKALETAIFPVQDFFHGWGAELLILIFPIVIIDAVSGWKKEEGAITN